MKIKSALYLLLIILLATFLSTTVAAEEEILDWPASVETKEITVIQGGDSIYYRYIPSETREYAIIYQNWVPLHYEIHAADGGFLDYRNWMDDNNHCYDIYTFNAGEEYIITFFYGGEPTPEGKYTGKITIAPWEDKLIIPDYPYIQDNEKITVTLSDDECVYYLYSPAQSGTYCVGKNTSSVLVNIGPVPQKPNDDPHYPDNLGDWFTDNQQGSLYHLEKGNLYLICIQEFTIPHGSSTITDTVWIRQGEAPKNEYPVWNINNTQTITLQSGENAKFYLTPTQSGRYMVRTTGGIRFEVSDSYDFLGTEFTTSDGIQGIVYDLEAGKQYTVMVEEWGSFADSVTGKFKFEKVGNVQSASIYVANFGSDHYILGLSTDPICGHLEGVTWSVSNPTAFPVIHQSETGIELEIRGSGKTTVTAKVGNITTSIELTSDPKLPVLKEGETLSLTIGGTAAEFTPTKSGKYQFTVNPDRDNMYFSVFTSTSDDPIYMKEAFSGKLTFTMNLNAGQKYELVQLFGKSTVSVKYAGGSSSQETTIPPTQSMATAPATTPQDTTEATGTTEPTEITEPDSTQPTTGGDEDTQIGSTLITADDITSDDLIKFENTQNSSFQISSDALRLAADQGSSLSLDFPSNVNVVLYNNILQSLCEDTTDEYITVSVTPQTYYDLNAEQQAALDGKSLVWLLDMTLTFDGNSIHELGGNAQITLPNPDSNKDWQILYLAEDGTVELLDITGEENISFTTDHFSKYALVFAEKTDADHSNLILWISISIVLLLIGGGTAAFFIIKKKRKQ